MLEFTDSNVIAQLNAIRTLKNTDVLFVGSSHCEFQPEIFKHDHVNVISLSIVGLRPIIEYYLLQDIIKSSSAKVVVLETFFSLFNRENAMNESVLKVLSNDRMSGNVIRMTLATKDFRIINSGAGLFIKHLRCPIPGIIFPTDSTVDTSHFIANYHIDDSVKSIRPYISNVSAEAFNYLQKCISLIKESGKTPMLVMAPVTPEMRDSCVNYSKICYSIDSCAKINHVIYINYNTPEDYPRIGLVKNADFKDQHHLSPAGQIKFSRIVLGDMKRLNLLPIKHS